MSIVRRTLAVLALACAAAAHSADITATLETANLRLRQDGPIPLEVRFQNPTPRLLEGRLEFTLLFGDRKAGVHRTSELVLQPGTQTIPVLLPPPADAQPGDGIAAHLRWLGSDGVRDLGDQQIGIYSLGTGLVLGVVRTERRLTDLDHARDVSLKFESLRPRLDAGSWIVFTTHEPPIASGNLPVHPLGLCAYDALFLDGPAFAAVNAKQLDALARWVEAGGSVGLCPDGPLEDRHVAFLDRLGASELPPVRFTTDSNRNLIRGAGEAILLRPGLGRAFVAVDPGSTPQAFERNEWRAAVGWLWRLRESEQGEVAKTGSWSKDFLRNGQGWGGRDGSALSSIWAAAAGFDALTPGAPRRMPLGVVALVLGALLLIAGPVDWFALGWLRRRRWTWVAFPLVCIGFAWWMAQLASRYLGVEDRSGRIRIVDVGDDGRPLREVRYELLLPARDREWVLDVRDGVAVPVPRSAAVWNPNSRVGSPFSTTGGRPFSPGGSEDSVADGNGEWISPGHFSLRRTLRQWTPDMVRITSFPGMIDGTQPDWDGWLDFFNDSQDVEKWRPAGPDRDGFMFAIPMRTASRDLNGRLRNLVLRSSQDELKRSQSDESFVRWVAFGTDSGILGGLGTGISPAMTGKADLLMPGEWPRDRVVLCAWRRAGGELLIYRRSFPGK